jgi:hypothetical protein
MRLCCKKCCVVRSVVVSRLHYLMRFKCDCVVRSVVDNMLVRLTIHLYEI